MTVLRQAVNTPAHLFSGPSLPLQAARPLPPPPRRGPQASTNGGLPLVVVMVDAPLRGPLPRRRDRPRRSAPSARARPLVRMAIWSTAQLSDSLDGQPAAAPPGVERSHHAPHGRLAPSATLLPTCSTVSPSTRQPAAAISAPTGGSSVGSASRRLVTGADRSPRPRSHRPIRTRPARLGGCQAPQQPPRPRPRVPSRPRPRPRPPLSSRPPPCTRGTSCAYTHSEKIGGEPRGRDDGTRWGRWEKWKGDARASPPR